MGKPAIDILLKGFVEYVIHDLKNNLWLLTDIYADAADDNLTKIEHGDRDYRNALDWFVNNSINVVMYQRKDRPKFPCVSIAITSINEHIPGVTIGDQDPDPFYDLEPSEFGVLLDKVYDDFTPLAYDKEKGIITMPDGMNTYQIAAGLQVLVEQTTGKAYVIKKCIDSQSFSILEGTEINLKNCYIVPVNTAWNAYRERTRTRETYEIGVHSTSDPVECIWLSQLIEYALNKYKSKYLDKRNMALSTYSISNISRNENYAADNVFSRFFSINFEVEQTWIREVAPKIARVQGGIYIIDGPKTPEELSEYIKTQYWKMIGDKPTE